MKNQQNVISSKDRNYSLPLLLFSNLMPLYGVIHWNWTFFSVVYLYWLELIIISTFQLLKILFAQGGDISILSKIFIGIKFFILRTIIFFFYIIFIVTFLGLMQNKGDTSTYISMADALLLRNNFFKINFFGFFLYNLLSFFFTYILNKEYKQKLASDYFNFFDIHIFVVHIVVVLGTFVYMGVTENLHWKHKSAVIACVSLFVVVKLIAEFIRNSFSEERKNEQPGDFI